MTNCVEIGEYKGTTTYEYWYDEDGNRTKYVKTHDGQTVESFTYEYNASNQMVSRTNLTLWSDNVTYYTYDGDGNLISEKTGLAETTYEYDAANRLSVVRAQGAVLMAALYDGDGNRLFTMDYTGENNDRWDIWIPECGGDAQEVDESAKAAMHELAGLVSHHDRKDYTLTQYVNDITKENEEVLAELTFRGSVRTAYTYGYTRESYETYYGDSLYYLYNAMGSVTRIATNWGRVQETYAYDPYGKLTYGIPDTVNYYGFNGESANLATGLQYLRARYYDLYDANFLSEDTYAGEAFEPLTLNRYAYVQNNPVNYIDPSGHKSQLGSSIKNVANKISNAVSGAINTVKGWFGGNSTTSTSPNNSSNKVASSTAQVVKETSDSGKKGMSLWDAYTHSVEMDIAQKVQQDKKMCEFLKTETGQIVGNLTLSALFYAELGMMTYLSGGMAAPSLKGAIAFGASSAVGGAIESYNKGENILVGATESFYNGSLQGAGLMMFPQIAQAVTKNPATGTVVESGLETAYESISAAVQGIGLNAQTVMLAFVTNLGLNNIDVPISKVKQFASQLGNVKSLDDFLALFKGGTGSKIQEVLELADNYTLSDDVYTNHILDRHGPNSTYSNKSHFMADFDIKDAIDSTLRGDNFIVGPNTNERAGYIFEQTFSYQIGTNSKGQPLYTLKVVIDEAGNVVTAFPKK